MKNTTPLNKLGFQIFRAVPFLLELKVFTDWSFTRTGLDVFQWIKFEVIYGDLFIARCINKGYIRHPLGQQIPKWMKFLIGILGTVGLVLVIAGPMLLFSSLNPIAEDNMVIGTQLDLSIEVILENNPEIINRYNLFSNDHVATLRVIQDGLYNQLNMSTTLQTRNIKRSLIQEIMMSSTSDTTWDIAPPSQSNLFDEIKRAQDVEIKQPINLRLSYSFQREGPPGNQQVTYSKSVDVTALPDSELILQSLHDAVDPQRGCQNQSDVHFTIKNMYYPIINLFENGDPEPIVVANQSIDVSISKSCKIIDNGSRSYWEITQSQFNLRDMNRTVNDNGLIFVPVSEKITPTYLGNYSILGFYTIIVYAVGTILRRGKFTFANF